ncbi:exonuclease domain-containing protein [Vreelandella alkaliphila]|uniref:Excinuclease cho n=1 Tax=Vreelandella alkaliphila TaxID=272774 RepID=A0A7C9NLI7_9GAMM|nr:exonuclease domain-containing protein [Halomonas alkaliphila]NDL69329.1 DNA polymerase III subunit epsilon [Halomonas alkaliphila]
MSDTPLIFIDVETTGTRATRDRITEIAALKVVNGHVTDRWISMINPGTCVPSHISQLTGIYDDMLIDAPAFATIAHALREWLGDACLVAHNARFDASFLRNEFKRIDMTYQPRLLCTLRLSRRLMPELPKHNLSALLAHFSLQRLRQHRAEDDAAALWQLWQAWQRQYDEATWQAALADEQRHRSLPAYLSSKQLAGLPASPGVYLFYGHNRLPLYVGKSINLRSRVLGHFQRDHQDDKEMRLAQQIQHIEWEETAGDLSAQLREAQLVKELMPIMNRQLRRQGQLKTWYWPSGQRYPTLVSGSVISQPQLGKLFGLFHSAKQAKDTLRSIAEAHQLCPQVLGLEKGTGRCFANQLGKCRGVCCGKEPMDAHTQRAQQALATLQVSSWPWQGRIIIREKSRKNGPTSHHVVDHWCYLGCATTKQRAQGLKGDAPKFDVDTYRILNRFLREPERHNLTVSPL